jgi:hypothetical protein
MTTQTTLEAVMTQEPTLSRFGFGVYAGVPKDERGAALAENRQALLGHAPRVAELCGWIRQHLRPIQTINPHRSSYGLKHIAEKDLNYVANGELIAAMLMCGYRFQRSGANAWFNVSEKAIKAVMQRQEMEKR